MCFSKINRRKALSLVEILSLYDRVFLRHIGAPFCANVANMVQQDKVEETWDFD